MDAPLSDWIGRTEQSHDLASATQVRALSATLDYPLAAEEGSPLPPLWHWLYHLPLAPISAVGPDGHPKRGGFLPPIALERRMWAGGRLEFLGDLRVGERLVKRSEIIKIDQKAGKTGSMVFVTVRHEITGAGGVAVREEQDIVYIAMPKAFAPPAPVNAPAGEIASEAFAVDPVLLFRFSAHTLNGHRIHYDRPYAMDAEKYPGLVVHGPLQAIALMEFARRVAPGRAPARYAFRGVRPAFDFDALRLVAHARDDGGLDLRAVNGDGYVCMQASVHWQ